MIDILVPILGRSPVEMLRSLEEASEVPHQVYFLCSPEDLDQIDICKATGHTTWVMEWPSGRADFARKINWAFERTEQPWIFQGADDIRFSHGWDTAALQLAEVKHVGVVGTNDLHNPAVKMRQHATHMFIRRAYIHEWGGTFDDTGVVFSERYDHQFVDNEAIALAKLRKQWAFAERSIVEHLHPVWNLGTWDATYDKAFREADADRRLFASRVRIMRAYRGSRTRSGQWRVQST